jgi:hypothetical protein
MVARGYVCRPGTERIPEEEKKRFLRNRNRDSCEKKCHRRGKHRNPEDSCRNYQPSLVFLSEAFLCLLTQGCEYNGMVVTRPHPPYMNF